MRRVYKELYDMMNMMIEVHLDVHIDARNIPGQLHTYATTVQNGDDDQ